jgi:hypothetical protein
MRVAIVDGFLGALCSLSPLDVYPATNEFEAPKRKRKKTHHSGGNEQV